jgi:hypothetical protein
MIFLNLLEVAAIFEFEIETKEILSLPGLSTHRDTDQWGRVHLICHIGVDQVQIGGMSRGTVACEVADDGDLAAGRARAIEWAQETRLGVLNNMEVAPLRDDHRSCSGKLRLRWRTRSLGAAVL